MRYRIFDAVLESDIALPELMPSTASRVQIRAELRSRRRADTSARGWHTEDQHGWPEVSRRFDQVRIRFARGVDFFVNDEGTLVTAAAPPRFPPATLRHLLIDQVIPMVLSARGRLIVHGSAVRTPWGGVLLVGASGVGKSTLAVALAQSGWKLLSDDYVRVQLRRTGPHAVAAYAGARLWPDVLPNLSHPTGLPRVSHYTAKRRLRRDALSGQVAIAAPLRRIYLLERGRTVGVSAMTPRETLVTLLSHIVRLDVGAAASERRRLDLLAALCGTVQSRRLKYPRDLRQTGRVQAAIANDLVRSKVDIEER